jgi:hypothetical protein
MRGNSSIPTMGFAGILVVSRSIFLQSRIGGFHESRTPHSLLGSIFGGTEGFDATTDWCKTGEQVPCGLDQINALGEARARDQLEVSARELWGGSPE